MKLRNSIRPDKVTPAALRLAGISVVPAGRDAILSEYLDYVIEKQTYFRSRKGREDQQAKEPAGRKQPDPGTGVRDQYEAVRRIQEIQAGFGHPLRRTEPRNRQAAGQQKADLPVEHVPRPALLFFGHVRRGEPDTPLHPIVRTPARPASRLLRGQQPLFPALCHAEQPAQPPARNEYLPGLADDGFRPGIVPVQDTPELQTHGKRQDGRSQGDPRRVAGRGRQGHAALRGDGLCLRLFLPAEQRPGGGKEIFHALGDRRCEERGEGKRLVPHAGSDVLRPGRSFAGFQYTQAAIEDAVFSNVQFRTTQMSKFYSIINSIYQAKEAKSKSSCSTT